jgi:hypothetical protein
LRSCVRLLPAADTRAARLPSALKALPFSDTCRAREQVRQTHVQSDSTVALC